MKKLSLPEWEAVSYHLKKLEGLSLSSASFHQLGALLGFSIEEKTIFLKMHLNSKLHFLTLSPKPCRALLGPKSSPPFLAFLKANFLDLKIDQVLLLDNRIQFKFSSSKFISFYLDHINLEGVCLEKSIHWAKPSCGRKLFESDEPARSIEQLEAQYIKRKDEQLDQQKLVKPSLSAADKKIKRLKKALSQIDIEIKSLEKLPWLTMGEKLSNLGCLPNDIDDFSKELIDTSQSFSWNLNNCYNQAKKAKKKIEGRKKRQTEIQKQIEDIQEDPQEYQKQSDSSMADYKKVKQGLELASSHKVIPLNEGLVLLIGKNAQDNLRILRKAKPWYLWFHIKGLPSAHGILVKPRAKQLSASQLKSVGALYAEQACSKGLLKGCEWLTTEVRYVRALKGGKGGVTYKNEKSFVYEPSPFEST